MAETTKVVNVIDSRSTIGSDPLRRFRFRAVFSPAPSGGTATGTAFDPRITSFSGGFNAITGLGIKINPIEYREGGYNTTAHKIPGQATFDDVTFSRGALYGNDGAITWMRGLFAAASGDGIGLTAENGGGFRCNISVFLMDHPSSATTTNTPRMGFFIHNAWISTLTYSGLDAGSNDLLFEGMTLSHEGISIAMVDVSTAGTISASSGNKIPAGFTGAV
jgi:hypothetical protein